jgi:hypothetical protein
MKIIKIIDSPKKDKRFRAIIDDGTHLEKHIDFGLKNPKNGTYIDHGDKVKRMNYWLRHLNNPLEKDRLFNLEMSPALLSARLLWGRTTDLKTNLKELNVMLALLN